MQPFFDQAFYAQDPVTVAKSCLGATLVVHDQHALIIETEAYLGEDDPASHAFKGLTPKNALMFEEPGHAYLYWMYGRYIGFNIVTCPKGIPGSVFLRQIMIGNTLINGPGKLTQALRITMNDQGQALYQASGIHIMEPDSHDQRSIIAQPRIGISRAQSSLLRFTLAQGA
jgi:DNA-3-methyladenine glycosylase